LIGPRAAKASQNDLPNCSGKLSRKKNSWPAQDSPRSPPGGGTRAAILYYIHSSKSEGDFVDRLVRGINGDRAGIDAAGIVQFDHASSIKLS
jgi:hypothetical protein